MREPDRFVLRDTYAMLVECAIPHELTRSHRRRKLMDHGVLPVASFAGGIFICSSYETKSHSNPLVLESALVPSAASQTCWQTRS